MSVCLSFSHQVQNDHHERIDFLTSREKKASKKKTGIVIGVIVGLLLLVGLAALLIWLFVCKLCSPPEPSGVETWSTALTRLAELRWSTTQTFVHMNHTRSWQKWRRQCEDNIYIPDAQTGTNIKNCKVDDFNLLFKLHSLILDWESDLCGCCNSPLVFAFLTASTLFFNNANKKNVCSWACTLFNIHLISFLLSF